MLCEPTLERDTSRCVGVLLDILEGWEKERPKKKEKKEIKYKFCLLTPRSLLGGKCGSCQNEYEIPCMSVGFLFKPDTTHP